MRKDKKIIFAAICLMAISVALTATTYAALTTTQNLSSAGSINVSPNLGVYSDSGCTTPLSSIAWGSLSGGGNKTQTVYVKNTGTGSSLTLSMTASNWSPVSASSYMTVTWNKAGTVLTPGASTSAIITLTVSPSVTDITSFNVQISITGTTP
jgi:hypothetical protein